MTRFAVVGYDHAHLPKYVPAIAAHGRAELVACVAPGANKDLARKDAKEHGARYLESLDELKRVEGGIDAAYVGTPPNQHREVIATLAEMGVHVLCDKPIATTLDDADAVIASTREAGVKLMVPFNPRFQLPVMRLKEAIVAGELGELTSIQSTKYGKIPRGIPGLDTSWFFDPPQAGFGGFGDIGIHAVDALRWLSDSEATSVYAKITRSIHHDIAVDDIGTAIIEFDNGVVASLQGGWANPPGNPTWLSVSFEAFGTNGAALVEKPYHDLVVSDQTRTELVPWMRRDVMLLVDEFIQAIEQDRAPAITGEDARAALEITLAAYESSKRGEVVQITR